MTIFIGEIVNDDARIQLALADSSIACTLWNWTWILKWTMENTFETGLKIHVHFPL
jgi:hypothetical protein